MPQISISLPSHLTTQHRRVVLKHFEKTERLSPQEWKMALQAFDMLGKGTIKIERRQMSFQQFYDRHVDRPYADDFIARLMKLEDLEKAETLQQKTAFEILAMLEREGFYRENLVSSEYLAAYCLYWWTSFAKGYRFELSIFRDLKASGIAFVAHDLRKRSERRSPYDLLVLRQVGDIKNTTYFLYSARALPLNRDFYITRLYHSQRRRYLTVVLMAKAAWRRLNGEVPTASLETAASLFPQPVQITFEGQDFVILPFDLWKDKVKKRQQEEIAL
jgi:hypothetical protein